MMPQPLTAPLVPELDVTDLDDSLQFYVDIVGFGVVFERRAERLAYLALEDAELMLQEAAGPGRRFRTATLERPFGRGINLQIAVGDVDAVLPSVLRLARRRARRAGRGPLYDVDVTTPAGRWNTRGPVRAGNRQFVWQTPTDNCCVSIPVSACNHSELDSFPACGDTCADERRDLRDRCSLVLRASSRPVPKYAESPPAVLDRRSPRTRRACLSEGVFDCESRLDAVRGLGGEGRGKSI